MAADVPSGDAHDFQVAVLVPTRRRLNQLRTALRSIASQTLAPARIIVAGEDNEDLPTESEQPQWSAALNPAHVDW
jgi:hypothetical protein